MKFQLDFTNLLLVDSSVEALAQAEVLAGKGEEGLREKLKQLKEVVLTAGASVKNVAIKSLISAEYLVLLFNAQNVKLT
jgi:TfoX/Sxy family transcriptional regulator of competence genes